jgi:hypothetical protein
MSVSSTDKGLLTPANCAVIFIDHQAQMFFGVANIDRQSLLNRRGPSHVSNACQQGEGRMPGFEAAEGSHCFGCDARPVKIDLRGYNSEVDKYPYFFLLN